MFRRDNWVLWTVVGLVMIAGCVALIGTTEPPAEPQPTPAEPVDNAELITKAIAAQEKAGRLAERATEAFGKHEFLWNQIAQGPQATAARLIADADDLERQGYADAARNLRADSDAFWKSEAVSSLMRNAEAATKEYMELLGQYGEADREAVAALEAVKEAGLWNQYLAQASSE